MQTHKITIVEKSFYKFPSQTVAFPIIGVIISDVFAISDSGYSNTDQAQTQNYCSSVTNLDDYDVLYGFQENADGINMLLSTW